MNNLEYYKNEIFEILDDNTCVLGLTKNNKLFDASCGELGCEDCIWNSVNGLCAGKKIEWLLAEHKEQPTITSNEKKLLELIEHGYITRDKDGEIFFTNKEPIKGSDNWFFTGFDFKEKYIDLSVFKNVNFDFIKWEDEEPWVIEDLLKLEVRDESNY